MKTVLKVEGMTCSHCENAVKTAFSALDGVSDVRVDLQRKAVEVLHDDSLSAVALAEKAEELGFDVLYTHPISEV